MITNYFNQIINIIIMGNLIKFVVAIYLAVYNAPICRPTVSVIIPIKMGGFESLPYPLKDEFDESCYQSTVTVFNLCVYLVSHVKYLKLFFLRTLI